jgi:hypothetical protein
MGRKTLKSPPGKKGSALDEEDMEEYLSSAGYGDENTSANNFEETKSENRVDQVKGNFDLGEAVDMLLEKKVNMREPGKKTNGSHFSSSL